MQRGWKAAAQRFLLHWTHWPLRPQISQRSIARSALTSPAMATSRRSWSTKLASGIHSAQATCTQASTRVPGPRGTWVAAPGRARTPQPTNVFRASSRPRRVARFIANASFPGILQITHVGSSSSSFSEDDAGGAEDEESSSFTTTSSFATTAQGDGAATSSSAFSGFCSAVGAPPSTAGAATAGAGSRGTAGAGWAATTGGTGGGTGVGGSRIFGTRFAPEGSCWVAIPGRRGGGAMTTWWFRRGCGA
mmetsp:Transcript_9611/g.31389  ORF Transcript_9611/g.31389 Transcript_9611/m.31389 type:complete len:249 (-) Transcript_9611:72-818(-)